VRENRSVSACLLTASLCLIATASAARGQAPPGETPVSLGSLSSGSALLQGGDDTSHNLLINGFGVAEYDVDGNSRDNSFTDGAFALSLYKSLTDQLSVFAQLTAAREPRSPFAEDQGEASSLETDIDNLQLRWIPAPGSGLDVTAGKFDSPLAVERDDAPLNFQATPSFTFSFARPVKFTGVAVHDAFGPAFEGWAIVANGWDVDSDNNKGKTGALYGLWSPSLAAHVGLGVIHGPEKDGTSADPRTTIVGTLLLQPAEKWVVGGEAVSGREPHSAPDGGTAAWTAGALFTHLRFGGHWAGTLRLDYLDDRDGARTGTPQKLESVTLSPQILFGGGFYGVFRYLDRTSLRLPEVALRLDLRYDRSSEDVFVSRTAGHAESGHPEAALQTVFLF
jgi:Putative beta-barrel porin-2, OmpL-like. bbp2